MSRQVACRVQPAGLQTGWVRIGLRESGPYTPAQMRSDAQEHVRLKSRAVPQTQSGTRHQLMRLSAILDAPPSTTAATPKILDTVHHDRLRCRWREAESAELVIR